MDRQIEYLGEILSDAELLTIQRNMLVSSAWLTQAILGTGVTVSGLPCVPTSPASMAVQVGTGALHALQNLDGTAYGSLAIDTTTAHQIVKQGLSLATQNLSCPAPSSAGQSIVYLIEAGYQDFDSNSKVLQYFNAANPSVAFTGPNNTGSAQNTTRQGLSVVQAKAGVAAPTGTQTAPSADSGFVGLYTVTVPYGATTITAGNIATLASAPFITTLTQVSTALAAQPKPLFNLQTVTNSSRTTVSGSTANGFVTALSGTINKSNASSSLVFWLVTPTFSSGNGAPIIEVTVGSQSVISVAAGSTPSVADSAAAVNAILAGLPAGPLAWSIGYARGDNTSWTNVINPTSSDASYFPATTYTTLVFGEIIP